MRRRNPLLLVAQSERFARFVDPRTRIASATSIQRVRREDALRIEVNGEVLARIESATQSLEAVAERLEQQIA